MFASQVNFTVLDLESVATRTGFVNEIVVILLTEYGKDGGVLGGMKRSWQ
jgi:hypothetical protein